VEAPRIDVVAARPGASYEAYREEIDAAVQRSLSSGSYILGPEVQAFEEAFAAWCEVGEVVGVANGTDAISLVLRACDIGPGAEVVTTPHTAVATVAAIEMVGATPRLADVDDTTMTLDPIAVSDVCGGSTGALLPVHLYGTPADLESLLAIGQRHGIPVIEDCAQAHGARLGGRRCGSLGRAGTFSFYPTKNLGAFGDGGAVATSDLELAEMVRIVAQYGWRERFVSSVAGWNSRLDAVQAAILSVKLRHLDADNSRRIALAQRYRQGLGDAVRTPVVPVGRESVYHLYVIRHPDRDALREHLASRGIGTAIQYPVPVHLQPAYVGRLGEKGSFPVAERAAREILTLPLYPELAEDMVDRVIEAVLEFTGAQGGASS
jgi:dTDP-4-amino-4,6-dideoxygalactose transaminase